MIEGIVVMHGQVVNTSGMKRADRKLEEPRGIEGLEVVEVPVPHGG